MKIELDGDGLHDVGAVRYLLGIGECWLVEFIEDGACVGILASDNWPQVVAATDAWLETGKL